MKDEKGTENMAQMATPLTEDEKGENMQGPSSAGLYVETEIKLHVPSGLQIKVIWGGQNRVHFGRLWVG